MNIYEGVADVYVTIGARGLHFVRTFFYIHTLSMRAVITLTRLRICIMLICISKKLPFV